jgi:hypothetical protein
MKHMKTLACVAALASAFLSTDALAWGSDGHRAVGAIAEKLIKGSHAERQVKALLLPGESLESITVWADTAKGGEGWPTPSPEQQAYTAANPRHNAYHYTNVPFQHDHYEDGAVGTTDVDIVQTLKQAIAVLQGKTDPALNPHKFTPRQALLLIAHMSGDIHQPLHVGAAYISKDGRFVIPRKHEDVDGLNIYDSRGGNNLLLDDDRLDVLSKSIPGVAKLEYNEKKRSTRPFHVYWDSTVVDYAMRRITTRTPDAFARKVIDGKPEVPKLAGDPATWPYKWANDTLVASKLAYTGVTPGAITRQVSKKGETYYTFALDTEPNYPVPSSDLAKKQLIKGGYQLAYLLQAIWP